MYDQYGKQSEVARMLAVAFDYKDIAIFGPKAEEDGYKKCEGLSVASVIKLIKEDIKLLDTEISGLADTHPAWITQALANESPKIIGIILRWLPSHHVRYILENLPKRLKMSLPKLVESFAVPTPILTMIKNRFEQKFLVPQLKFSERITFEDVAFLNASDLEVLFYDLGLQELAMAFQCVDSSGLRVLLNRMSVADARAMQSRVKDVCDTKPQLLKDARYTILEVAMDQKDMKKLLTEIGIASFSKALKDDRMFSAMQMRLDPKVSYILRRYIDQHVGANKLADLRQEMILVRVVLLSKAGRIDESWAGRLCQK